MHIPIFTFGVEEEYLLVDAETMDLAEAPQGLMDACKAKLGGQVSPEFLRCQVEVGTRKCANIAEAREDLAHLRRTVASCAADHGLRPLAASCHPFADWKDQSHTHAERYDSLNRDLAAVAQRMLICGMHVHVGIDDDELRIDLMNQFSYFLPHLLALSTSSPFWQGRDMGLASYRLTVFDNLPRTGLPPQFSSWSQYNWAVQTIVNTGAIQDASKIWWDLRPSVRFPTLEVRICDVSPTLDHTLSIASVIQALMRKLWRLGRSNQSWRSYDRFLIGENRWRAQRYGAKEGLVDFGSGGVVEYADLLDELIELIAEDADALGCLEDVQATRNILKDGTGTERQRRLYAAQREAGMDHAAALRATTRDLCDSFLPA